MQIGESNFEIGTLKRKLTIEVYDWAVRIIKQDKGIGDINTNFETRYLRYTKTFPTTESNIKRGMKWFKAPNEAIEDILDMWKSVNKG